MTVRKLRIFIVHGSHHLTDHQVNGDGLVAWGFISELAGRGHRIHVLTDRLEVRSSPPPNLTLVEIPRTRRSGLAHYASYMRRAREYFHEIRSTEGVDVIHQMNPVVRGLSLALLGTGTPIVLGTYVGDWENHKFGTAFKRPRLRRRIALGGKRIVDVAQQLAATRLLLATPHALGRIPFSPARSRVRFLQHGVDAEAFAPESLASDPAARPCSVLYVGHFHRQKGVLDLVEGLGAARVRLPALRAVFVGSGPEEDAMKRRLGELGLADRVEFPGRATRHEVAGWMRACDLLCAPSYGEPYGQNVLEAMAAAKPVAITDAGGHRHLGDPIGKVSVRPGDVDGIANALVEILSNPERSRAMGSANRALVERFHAWPRAVDRLEEIYGEAIAAARRVPSSFISSNERLSESS